MPYYQKIVTVIALMGWLIYDRTKFNILNLVTAIKN